MRRKTDTFKKHNKSNFIMIILFIIKSAVICRLQITGALHISGGEYIVVTPVIAIANQKGRAVKMNTNVNLEIGLVRKVNKVLIDDAGKPKRKPCIVLL
jgi:hypothetical protein